MTIFQGSLWSATVLSIFLILTVEIFNRKFMLKRLIASEDGSSGSPWIQFSPMTSRRCSSEDTRKNVKYISDNGGLSSVSACPTEDWIYAWRRHLPAQKHFVTVEVGCNKATDAIQFLRLFGDRSEIDLYRWIEGLTMSFVACQPDYAAWNVTILEKNRKLRSAIKEYSHYCIEPVKETFETINRLSYQFGYNKLGLSIHQFAFSASTDPDTVLFSPAVPGDETIGIDFGPRGNETYPVKVTSVDKFVFEHQISRVDILKIDTEGNDPRVLLGSAKTLAILRPRYVSFENHQIGRWATFDLKDIIDYMDNLSYDCFWSTKFGTLIRITACWSSDYEQMKAWSNIACVYRGDHVLDSIMRAHEIK